MGEGTGISWSDDTFNPWHGCFKISPGCTNCYAEVADHRMSQGPHGGGVAHWGKTAPRRFFGDNHWNEPLRWNRSAGKAGTRRRVFCGSLCDWAEDREDLIPHRQRLWKLIAETQNLDWLLLTKRPENLQKFVPWSAAPHRGGFAPEHFTGSEPVFAMNTPPWSNVWLGVTAENKEEALHRIPLLREVPAMTHFVSYEPALEDIGDVWDQVLAQGAHSWPIDWLIAGNESGNKRRPAEVDWFRTARDAAQKHNAAYHLKQWAGDLKEGIEGTPIKGKIHLPVLDGKQWAEFPE